MMKITAHEICSSVANQLGTLPKKAFAMHDALELIAITEGVCPSRNARFFAATVGAAMEIFDEIYDKNPVARAHN